MIAIKEMEMPKGCQKCKFFSKLMFGNGLDYGYSCDLGAKDFPMPWIRQMEERASDCPLVAIEPLTDSEQRIFLSAMSREERICKELDSEKVDDSTVKKLMPIVYGIERKVKKALWK